MAFTPPSSSGALVGSYDVTAPVWGGSSLSSPGKSSSGGWLGSWTDPFGVITSLKNIGTGLASSAGNIVASGGEAIGSLAHGDLSGAASNAGHFVQGFGDIGGGIFTGLEGLGNTAVDVASAGLLDKPYKDIMGKMNAWLASSAEINGGNETLQPFSNAFEAELYNKGQGYKPRSFFDIGGQEGLFSAAIQTAASAAVVAGPVAGVASAIGGDATEAANIAENAGALDRAAKFSERAAKAQQVVDVAGKVKQVGSFAFNPFMGEESFPSFARDLAGGASSKLAAQGAEGGLTAGLSGFAKAADLVAHPFHAVGFAISDALKAQFLEKANRDEATTATPQPTSTEQVQTADAGGVPAAGPPEPPTTGPPAPPGGVGPEAVRANLDPVQGAAQAFDQADSHPLANEARYNAATDPSLDQAPLPRSGTIPIDQLTPNVDRLNHEITQLRGDEEPITVAQHPGGEVRVVDGNHRLEAYRNAGVTDIPYQLAPEGAVNEFGAPGLEKMLGEQVTPKVEPDKYNVPLTEEALTQTPEEVAAQQAADQTQVRAETAAARERIQPPLWQLDQQGKVLSRPVPEWAKTLAKVTPDSMNRLLANTGQGFMDQVRMRSAIRNVMQVLEMTQAYAKNNPATMEGKALAIDLMESAGHDRALAQSAAGQEVFARLLGEQQVGEWAANHHGMLPSDEMSAALRQAARGDYPGITQEMWDQMSPEVRGQVEQHLQAAVDGYKAQYKDTMQTLLASRFGAKSLEAALLDPNEVTMTKSQTRMYRDIQRLQRMKAKYDERIPAEQDRLDAKAAKAQADGRVANAYADELRRQQGTNEATIPDLQRGVLKGMEKEGESTIAHITDNVVNEGGSLHDVATDETLHPNAGIFVTLAPQGVGVRMDDPNFAQALHDYLHEAIFFPKADDGSSYDPTRLWDGLGARLSTNIITNPDGTQSVIASIGMHEIAGDPITPLQAGVIGAAYGQPVGFNFATGESVPFTDSPMVQTAAQHFLGEVLDPKSTLRSWIKSTEGAIGDTNITPDEANGVLGMLMTLDRLMVQRNAGWKQGDIFKVDITSAKNLPKLPFLAQTIMPTFDHGPLPEGVPAALLDTHMHFMQALQSFEVGQVAKILKWYHDSHDFIEHTWRYNTPGDPTSGVKMMPFGGRPAAEVFYDLLAVTSVMASPTQNLGRALAGFDNYDNFLSSRKAHFDSTVQLMDELFGNKPSRSVRVENVGRTLEDILKEGKLPGETQRAFEKRQIDGVERVLPEGSKKGTSVSVRWLDSPLARELTDQTSMVTSPKYRIIDILMGKTDLSTATADELNRNAEWWTGKSYKSSDVKLPPASVLAHARLLGLDTPEVAQYREWAARDAALKEARAYRQSDGWVRPIIDREDVQRQRAQAEAAAEGKTILGGREVSPTAYGELVNDGRAIINEKATRSAPHVLNGEQRAAMEEDLWPKVQQPWGGETVDAHTGENHVGLPGEQVVTIRTEKMKELGTPVEGLTREKFHAALNAAIDHYGPALNYGDAHLGVFHNEDTGNIEFDPTVITDNVHDTEAVGSYTRANGGAYDYASRNAYWIPHVADEAHPDDWSNKGKATKDTTASTAEGRRIARTPGLRPAYENALMEYHGSSLLAKLRSFRANLANPTESLHVTLDSIMAQLWGYDQTFWGGKGNYQQYADYIRNVANAWTQINKAYGDGTQVMPHEVQALLWVYAKKGIGEQDWGRIQAHSFNAMKGVSWLEDAVKNHGANLDLSKWDPFAEYWRQQLQFSRDQLAVRNERETLQAKRTNAEEGSGRPLSPRETARLRYLETEVPTRQATQVMVQRGYAPGDMPVWEQRDETSYDASKLSKMEMQLLKYQSTTLKPMREAIMRGDFAEAKRIIADYAASRQVSTLNGIEGDAFGQGMLNKALKAGEGNVTFERLTELAKSEHVPHPNVESFSTGELGDRFANETRGVTMEPRNTLDKILVKLYHSADLTTLLHESLHAFRLMAPGDEVAQFSEYYPHIQDARLTPERVADEEKFVSDFMVYLYERARAGDQNLTPEQRGMAEFNHPLKGFFNNVADVLDEHQQQYGLTPGGQGAMPNITGVWDQIFNTHIEAPSVTQDPLVAQYAPENKGVNPTKLRGESTFAYTQRVRQLGEARGRAQEMPYRVAAAQRLANKADAFANDMTSIATEGKTDAAVKSARAGKMIEARSAKLAAALQTPEGQAVPRLWRPYMDAIDRVREEAKLAPEMAPLLEEIPANFSKALELAAQLGFEPTHIPELTWPQVKTYLSGHLSLGTSEQEASMRKLSRGVVAKGVGDSGTLMDRSLAALGAGTVIAMKELLQSKLFDHIETYYAKQWDPGKGIPDGWRPWSSTRDAIITGKTLDGSEVALNADKVIPEAVYKALRNMQGAPVDLKFRNLWKGGPVAVWKHLILTYSPTWYIKHFVGAVSMATLEGVRLQDWRLAIKQWRSDTLPYAALHRDVLSAVDEGLPANLIKASPFRHPIDTARAEGQAMARPGEDATRLEQARGLVRTVDESLHRIVTTTDKLARAAVYARAMRITEGNVAFATSRAFEAIGDFNRLSPTERGAVSAIIPFYAFQKAMFMLLRRMPVDHPLVTMAVMQLGSMNQAYLRDKLGAVPDSYLGSAFVGAGAGKLTQLDKLNPLSDGWKLATPQGITDSLHPYIKPLVAQATGQNTYGSVPEMGSYGQLQSGQDIRGVLHNTFGTNPLTQGSMPNLNTVSALSDKQYKSLVKRILNTKKGIATARAPGGYLTVDAATAKKKAG